MFRSYVAAAAVICACGVLASSQLTVNALLSLSTQTPQWLSASLCRPQIGGSDTTDVREACRLARPYKYDAINLNCGCPSEKVAGKGAFGAALMRTPSLVKDLCLAMKDGAGEDTPITVKCRIGVDNDDSYEQLAAFVEEVGFAPPCCSLRAEGFYVGTACQADGRGLFMVLLHRERPVRRAMR